MARSGGRWTAADLEKQLKSGNVKIRQPGRTSNGSSLQVPFIQQPNAFTCGPTCVAILASAVRAPSRKLPPSVIGEFAGTNPATGTTEVEMAAGLTFAGLDWRRGSARSLQDLRRDVMANNLVALRTLIHGMKHWVVVHDCNPLDDTFSIMCPATGPGIWSGDQLLQRWAARDFDHFVIPGAPIAHQPSTPSIHELTFDRFINGARVLRDSEQRSSELRMIEDAAETVQHGRIDPLHRIRHTFEGWTYYRDPSPRTGFARTMFGVHESRPDTISAGIVRGLTYITPEMRGKGGGVGLLLAAYSDSPHRYVCPTHFSEAGYATRVRAHAVAIELAESRGLAVSQQVRNSSPALNPQVGGPRYVHATPRRGEALADRMGVQDDLFSDRQPKPTDGKQEFEDVFGKMMR